MIVGCYSMDLYCENRDNKVCLDDRYVSVQFQATGRTERDCLKDARAFGWKFPIKDGMRLAFCPKCKGVR